MAQTLNELADPGDLFGYRSSKLSSELKAKLASMGLDLQTDFFSQLREDEAPTRDARNAAIDALRGIGDGTYQFPDDPALAIQQNQAITDIGKASAASGKSFSGGARIAEQDALGALASNSRRNQLDRLLGVAGFQNNSLLDSNQLIGANISSQGNQQQNLNAINQAGGIGKSNAIFNVFNQGSRVAGAIT